jgi:hemerythrin
MRGTDTLVKNARMNSLPWPLQDHASDTLRSTWFIPLHRSFPKGPTLAFIEFTDRFKVGHFLLDQQHRELFALLSRLHEAITRKLGAAEINGALAPLHFAMIRHFQTEENLMQKNFYPGYLDHKQIHDGLVLKLVDVETRLKEADESLPLSVAIFLKDWLSHHISQEDRRIVEHIDNRTSNRWPSP